MKKPVVQKDNLGCAAACIAFVVDKDYLAVFEGLGKKRAKMRGFYCRELVNYLNKIGYQAEFHYLNKKWRREIYQEKTIVFIKRSQRYPFGHYLVRYQNFWMDPWINFSKDQNIKQARAGFRKRLPGKPIYGIFLRK